MIRLLFISLFLMAFDSHASGTNSSCKGLDEGRCDAEECDWDIYNKRCFLEEENFESFLDDNHMENMYESASEAYIVARNIQMALMRSSLIRDMSLNEDREKRQMKIIVDGTIDELSILKGDIHHGIIEKKSCDNIRVCVGYENAHNRACQRSGSLHEKSLDIHNLNVRMHRNAKEYVSLIQTERLSHLIELTSINGRCDVTNPTSECPKFCYGSGFINGDCTCHKNSAGWSMWVCDKKQGLLEARPWFCSQPDCRCRQ